VKLSLTAILVFILTTTNAQINQPKIEVSALPGLFFEQLSADSLVPPGRRNKTRLGDVTSYAIQVAVPLKNKRFTIKAGAGFSQRHYSLNKYGIGDIFTALFLFDSPARTDSFNLSYVRFTNNYFQVPVSASYTVTRPVKNFQLSFGLNLRSDFLIKSNPHVVFDSTYKTPSSPDIAMAKSIYARNATNYVLTIQPYMEGLFNVYKKLGLFFQFSLLSASTKLDTQLTTSTTGIFDFSFGAFYNLK
jgi:hypothetical protein